MADDMRKFRAEISDMELRQEIKLLTEAVKLLIELEIKKHERERHKNDDGGSNDPEFHKG